MSSPFLALALIILVFKAGVSAPCGQGVVNFSVSTFEDAEDLRDALTCSGVGYFYAEWTGEVNIGALEGGFAVGNGSSLNVTGIGGNAVINGDSRIRIFTLTNGSHLYLNNVSLENGLSDEHYGGGAVWAMEASHVSAANCSFLDNSAVGNVGGAMFAGNSTVRLSGDIVFSDNRADYGGALQVDGELAKLICEGDTSFLRNYANCSGGAMSVVGGAMFASEGVVVMEDNLARGHAELTGGGAIYVEGGNVYLRGETILVNNSANLGGAIYSNDLGSTGHEIIISGTSYFRNNSADNGGAIMCTGSNTNLTFESMAYFESNSARSDGGALNVFSVETIFGGEIYFSNNSARREGGAVRAWNANFVTGKIEWFGNTAGLHGGALIISYCDQVIFGDNNVFSHNSANGNGGAIFSHDCDKMIFDENVTWSYNTANLSGGAIFASQCESMIFNGGASWLYNTAGTDGGAIYLIWSDRIMFVGDTEWSYNTADGEGGALFIYMSDNSTFDGQATWNQNSAKGDGGALLISGSDNTTFNGETAWSNNSAKGNGGALAVNLASRGTTFDEKSMWFNNHAEGSGGAIYASSNITFIIEPSYDNNVASSEGDDISYGGGDSAGARVGVTVGSAYLLVVFALTIIVGN